MKITVHDVFILSVFTKGVDAILEIIGGFLLLLVKPVIITSIVRTLTQHELSEDPADILANFFIREASKLSVSSQLFGVFYLFSHGVIKIFLVISLLQRRLWAYPTAIVFFSGFIIYQVYRYQFTHSLWLIFLTVVDFFVIIFTLIEYRQLNLDFRK